MNKNYKYYIKLSKFLAYNINYSYRKIDKLINLKKIIINNKFSYLSQKIFLKNKIFINNKKINYYLKKIPKLILYNKNNNEIVSNYNKKKKIIFNNLPILKKNKWLYIGRLDLNTKGLLLFTTSGKLKNNLLHPNNFIKRKYLIKIKGKLNLNIKNKLLNGIKFKNYFLFLNKIFLKKYNKKYSWYKLSINEGKNKQIHNIFNIFKIKIINLIRIKYGIIYLPKYLKKKK